MNPLSASRAFDPGMLPRRRGAGRIVGIALSLVAAVGAGAGGGYHLWKTRLDRPALVAGLPRMPALVAGMAPVQAASAAPGEAPESLTGAAPEPLVGAPVRPRENRAVPVAGSAEASPAPAPRYAARETVPMPPQPEEPQPRPPVPAVEPGAGAALDPPAGEAGDPAAATGDSGAEPRSDAGPVIEIRKGIRDDRVAASLERAYAAFRAGDLESAADAYRIVAGREPGNRDALLGLAAVATRAGRGDEAAGHYARVLAFHPADTVAQAALIAIEERDPTHGESRLKALLWREPQAAHLHFDLGNAYAAQSRWPEAQQSYFNAYRFDRENADYAYNLAVSLDHLSRRESALGFYREALALAGSRPASFETAAVLARIREIGGSAGENATLAHPLSEPAGAAPAAGRR